MHYPPLARLSSLGVGAVSCLLTSLVAACGSSEGSNGAAGGAGGSSAMSGGSGNDDAQGGANNAGMSSGGTGTGARNGATSGGKSGAAGEAARGGTGGAVTGSAGTAGADTAGKASSAGQNAGGAANTGGSGGGAAGATTAGAGGATTLASCSEAVLRTAPPAGKEAFRAEPIDTQFPFSTHWMGMFSDDPKRVSMTSFADLDRDGDLDFASGQRQDHGGGMVWWEYCSADHWVRHTVGTGHTSWAGGNAGDFDGDGWVDLIAGDSWYKNPQNPRTMAWQRYAIGAPSPEEIIVGDVNADGKPEALYVHNSVQPQYFSPGATPTQTWVKGPQFQNRQQQGGAIGDLDGDGDNDILVGYRWWYRNVDGKGGSWETVTIFASGFPDAPLTYLGDLDGDGDTDIILCEHFGKQVAWAENQDGKGTQFALHSISTNKAYLHTIVAADFDNDGDLDLFAGQNLGPSWIFDNTDGKGTFAEHRIAADTRAHESRVGDVDCDGDLDIAGKPWGDQVEGGETSATIRDHVYLKNELVEKGGTPKFERGPYEVLYAAQARVCKP